MSFKFHFLTIFVMQTVADSHTPSIWGKAKISNEAWLPNSWVTYLIHAVPCWLHDFKLFLNILIQLQFLSLLNYLGRTNNFISVSSHEERRRDLPPKFQLTSRNTRKTMISLYYFQNSLSVIMAVCDTFSLYSFTAK